MRLASPVAFRIGTISRAKKNIRNGGVRCQDGMTTYLSIQLRPCANGQNPDGKEWKEHRQFSPNPTQGASPDSIL